MAYQELTMDGADKGIVKALPSSKVVWADGNNIRFDPGYVSKTPGKATITTNSGSWPVRAMFTFVGTDGAVRTIVCCDTAVYAFNSDFTVESIITPTPAPTGGEGDDWSFALVAGLPILSNGKDAIWKWASYASVLTALSGAPTKAKHISSCLNRLVASSITEGGYTYTGRVRWSEMGNPENWTIDTTNKSGRHDIMDYHGGIEAFANIKAQLTRGHQVWFWAQRGFWTTDFSAATKVFMLIAQDIEVLGPRAVCQLGQKIYFMAKDELYYSMGGEPTPFGLEIKDDLLANLNTAYADRCYAFPTTTNEVWFCIPSGDSTVPDMAYVYDEVSKSWSICDVDFLSRGERDLTMIPTDIVGDASGRILDMDSGYNTPAGAIYGWIETGDMHFGKPDRMKIVSEVIPEPKEQALVSEIMIRIGVRNRLADDLKWSDPVPYTIGVSSAADFNGFRKEGKFVRIRFYSEILDSPWAISGYTIKFEFGGTR